MNLPVRYRVAAKMDIARRARRYARIDTDLSHRFLDALADTENAIARSPELGSPWETTRKRMANLRYHPVIGFENLLVFYRKTRDEIIVLRVLHTHQNIAGVFPTNGQN